METHKRLYDLALEAGRTLQSNETGFIHTFHGKKEPPHQAVSFVDNLLFVLALFRSKTMEGVQEGKLLLEKLLAYQSPEGLFPVYLHEFPFCHDRHIGGSLVIPLVEIYRNFHHVLGKELSLRLARALEKLLEASLNYIEAFSWPNRFRVGGALIAFDQLFSRSEWKKKGIQLLDVPAMLESPSRFIPEDLGMAFSGALLGGREAANTLMEWMRTLWHPHLLCYSGPMHEMQLVHGTPEVTLFDLYMAAELQTLPGRAQSLNKQLLGALLYPYSALPENVSKACHGHTLSWIEGKRGERSYPFTFLWGAPHALRSLLLHTPHPVYFDGVDRLTIEMGAAKDSTGKDPGREIFWYVTETPAMKIMVNGVPATTFRAKDIVTIEDDSMRMQLVFEAEAGIFQGHLSKASAPTEQTNFGRNRFNAYQWQLLFRAIVRPEPCHVSVQFTYVPKS